jgi:CMP-N-acetylneuraminic acid synthetase
MNISNRVIGVVAAKENSNRFKNKNIYSYKDAPLFWHNVKVMTELGISVYVLTDSEYIKQYCEERGVITIWRNENINHDNQSLFEVLKFAYHSLPEFDIMINVMANIIDAKSDDILKAIEVLVKNNLHEVRTVNDDGVENGVMILSKEVFSKHEISAYVGAITTNSKEIHYESEITGD